MCLKTIFQDKFHNETHFDVIGCKAQTQIDMLKYCEVPLDSTFVMWYTECLNEQ